MVEGPYREMASVVQDPIAAEFDRIDEIKHKEAKKKLDRVLKHMVYQYAHEKPGEDGWWALVDPGVHWWNLPSTIPNSDWDTTFGNLLDERCKSLYIMIGSRVSEDGILKEKILTWKFETDEGEECT